MRYGRNTFGDSLMKLTVVPPDGYNEPPWDFRERAEIAGFQPRRAAA